MVDILTGVDIFLPENVVSNLINRSVFLVQF